MRGRVGCNEGIGTLGAANEAEYVDEASLHDWAHCLAARAGYEVDHTGRQCRCESLCGTRGS